MPARSDWEYKGQEGGWESTRCVDADAALAWRERGRDVAGWLRVRLTSSECCFATSVGPSWSVFHSLASRMPFAPMMMMEMPTAASM